LLERPLLPIRQVGQRVLKMLVEVKARKRAKGWFSSALVLMRLEGA